MEGGKGELHQLVLASTTVLAQDGDMTSRMGQINLYNAIKLVGPHSLVSDIDPPVGAPTAQAPRLPIIFTITGEWDDGVHRERERLKNVNVE